MTSPMRGRLDQLRNYFVDVSSLRVSDSFPVDWVRETPDPLMSGASLLDSELMMRTVEL